MSTASSAPCAIGVGFDTARYGHHVTFLRQDLQPALPGFDFAESRPGYQRLQAAFQQLQERWPSVHFHIRIDAAGQYASNLETFLQQLPAAKTISVGEPERNQHYRKALFPKRKADPIDSLCAARFALTEKPPASVVVPVEVQHLREIVGRLQGQVRHSTRLTNQLHNLLARVFPELALLVVDLQARWVLRLLLRYPTPVSLARARPASLTALPHVTADKAEELQASAQATVASFTGPVAAQLVRDLTGQLLDSLDHEEKLHTHMRTAFQALPDPHVRQIESIPGIGAATAAVLAAKIVRIERFPTPEHLVGYFGIFPEEDSSGVDKHGQPKPGRQQHLSKKGNDLVRRYLWNAAKSAILHNPAVRALYQRLRARGARGDVALGHCMRKLLHLVFAIWRTGQPFDPQHYPWEHPDNKAAAGHNQALRPEGSVVTAADSTVDQPATPVKAPTAPTAPAASAGSVAFAALRSQVRMEQVLERLGHLTKLKGSGPQRRGPCPIHAPDRPRGHTFSVHLDKKVFQCFHPPCGAHGNVLDLWAAVRHLPLYQAALDLAETFHLQPATEKRNP